MADAGQHNYIGIDIGGTNLRGALIGANGEILERFRCASAIDEGRPAFLQRLTDGIVDLRRHGDRLGRPVRGVGVGVPGLIDRNGLVHASVNLQPLESLNLRELLERELDLPVVCSNDANLIALGEHRFGAGRGYTSLLVTTIGTGLGSGLILGGALWEGAYGFAAEFGHVTVEPEGRPCPCGNHGCLEQYVAAPVLVREGGGMTPEALAERARTGNSEALAIFERMGRYLGTALAGLLNTLNLEAVVIGGGVAACYELLSPAILQAIRERCFPQIAQGVVLCKAALGDDAGLLGAAMLAHDRGNRCL